MKLTDQAKLKAIEEIKQFFYNERDEEIGEIAARTFLDFIEDEIGPHFYNQGVLDAKKMIEDSMLNLESNLASLERVKRR